MDQQTAAYSPHDLPLQMAYRQGGWLVLRLRRSWVEAEMNQEAYLMGKEAPDTFPPKGVDVYMKQSLDPDGWYLIVCGILSIGRT